MSSSCFMLGLALGSLIFGVLSDKIGRKHTLLIAILTARLETDTFQSLMPFLVSSISSVVASQMPGYVSYSLLRIPIGAGSEGWSENILVHNKH